MLQTQNIKEKQDSFGHSMNSVRGSTPTCHLVQHLAAGLGHRQTVEAWLQVRAGEQLHSCYSGGLWFASLELTLTLALCVETGAVHLVPIL